MAHPLFIMEQALRQFSSQWYAGFRPSLEIQTKYDGSLVVQSKSFCSNKPPSNWWEKSSSQPPFSSTPRSKRAKKNARYRRNKEHRMEASKSGTTTDVETQYSVEDGATNTETNKRDSGINENSDENFTSNATENSHTCPDNDPVGSGFSDKQNDKSTLSKATYVPPNSPEASENKTVVSEVSYQNSTAAIHQCEGCLKEFDRTLEHHSNNLNCKDCHEAQKSLDPKEETQPKDCSCNGDHICQACKDLVEQYFCLLLSNKNLLPKQKINKVKLPRSFMRENNYNCYFCSRDQGLHIYSMKMLGDIINLAEDPPCMECKLFFYTQSWFSLEEVHNSLNSLAKSVSLHGKGSSSSS